MNKPDGLMMNFGCGSDYLEGFVNVDHSRAVKADAYSLEEVEEKYGENSFGFILMKHSFEHVYDQLGLMERLYKLCNSKALIEIMCPYWSSIDAWSDPDHKRAISERTFYHFNRGAYFPREDGKRNPITPAHPDHYLPHCDFEPVKLELVLNEPWVNASQDEQMRAVKHFVNAVDEMHVLLRCIKPGREMSNAESEKAG